MTTGDKLAAWRRVEDAGGVLAMLGGMFAVATAILLLIGGYEFGLVCLYGIVFGIGLLIAAFGGAMQRFVYRRSRRRDGHALAVAGFRQPRSGGELDARDGASQPSA